MAVRQAPLLPLRDIVVFPYQVVPLFVGRERSIAALQHAMANDKEILLAAQKRAKTNEPVPEDIFEIGTIASIVQLLHLPDGTVKVIVEGKHRARIQAFDNLEPFFLTSIEPIDEPDVNDVELEALIRSLRQTFESYAKLNKRVPPETIGAVGLYWCWQCYEQPAKFQQVGSDQPLRLILQLDMCQYVRSMLESCFVFVWLRDKT